MKFRKRRQDGSPRAEDSPRASGRLRTIVRIGSLRVSVLALVIWALAIATAGAAGFGAFRAYQVFTTPRALFGRPLPTIAPVETPSPTVRPGETGEEQPTPAPSVDPYEYAMSIADRELMKDIVNVLVIGVDYADERATWNKNFYSDVMLVLAINFEKNTVDMISVPRDTYAKIANVEGIYKLNSSVHHGGGVPDGFMNVCRSVSGVLGGIPIDYYVGVTMPVVKELVNEIGGVEYDVDVKIRLQGRTIEPGLQHMDGQKVLDYLRARKGIDHDLGRVNRQKKMLVALFKKMKQEKTILDAPALVLKYKDRLHTNLSTAQVAALAVFAYNLDSDYIRMHTMPGKFMDIFNWLFIITDQPKRVQLIKEIYGIDVPEQVEYALDYCVWMWADHEGRGFLKLAGETLARDDAAATRKISWENRIAIQQAMDALSAELEKQKNAWDSLINIKTISSRLSKAKSLGVSSDALRAAVDHLEDVAAPIFSKAGYSVRWYVPENPGDARMTG